MDEGPTYTKKMFLTHDLLDLFYFRKMLKFLDELLLCYPKLNQVPGYKFDLKKEEQYFFCIRYKSVKLRTFYQISRTKIWKATQPIVSRL